MREEPQKAILKEVILYKNYVALSSEYKESDGEDSKIFEEFYDEVEKNGCFTVNKFCLNM